MVMLIVFSLMIFAGVAVLWLALANRRALREMEHRERMTSDPVRPGACFRKPKSTSASLGTAARAGVHDVVSERSPQRLANGRDADNRLRRGPAPSFFLRSTGEATSASQSAARSSYSASRSC